MNKTYFILKKEYQDYIDLHLKSDPVKLLLGKSSFPIDEMKALIEQINAKRRCEKKLPSWFNSKGIIYPNKLNIEQTSSEISAKHKAGLISGASIADLTGGFGIDCFYFVQKFKWVTHFELNEELSLKAAHNFEVLKISNITCVKGDGIELCKAHKYDWLYIDPSRRNDSKGKVFLLSDCLPNVPENLVDLFKTADNILIKVSPMLDITQGIKELQCVKEVHVVAVKNEVKELLFILQNGFDGAINVHSTQIASQGKSTTIVHSIGSAVEYKLGEIDKYIYEPNASVMKTQGYNYWSAQFDLYKLSQHTHLFTSAQLIDFPGRRFKVISISPFNKKSIKKKFGKGSFNVISRNFPKSVAQLRSEYNLIDKDGDYLFFVAGIKNEKLVIEAELIHSINID
jgi:hypothetical protein